MQTRLSMHWRWALAVAALAALTVSAASQRPEIAIDPPAGLDLPRPPPVNHLARCLANPDDKISCHVARTAKRDGGLESAVAGHMNPSVYVPCRRGTAVCLEVATFDADERTAAGVAEPPRLPSIDVDILFDYDRADIRGSEEAKLKQLADAMLHPQAADVRFVIVGHTDGKGPDAYNCRLSSGRAGSVRERLAALGVNGGDIPGQRGGVKVGHWLRGLWKHEGPPREGALHAFAFLFSCEACWAATR